MNSEEMEYELVGIKISRQKLIGQLVDIVGHDYVLWNEADLLVYEYDGSIDRGNPVIIALPRTTKEIAKITTVCRAKPNNTDTQ